MKALLRFRKTTLIGGVMFLLPLVIAVYLLQKALAVATKIVGPLAAQLPIATVVGVRVADLIAALALVAVAFLAGLIARTGLGRRLVDRLENLILRKVPGYTLLKSAAAGATGKRSGSEMEKALANIDDAWLLSFIVEEHASGLLTVFVPSAPTPAAGSVYFLREDQVKRVDIPVGDAVKVIMRLGAGSRQLLEGKIPSPNDNPTPPDDPLGLSDVRG